MAIEAEALLALSEKASRGPLRIPSAGAGIYGEDGPVALMHAASGKAIWDRKLIVALVNAYRDGSLIHRSALAEDTARAAEGMVLATGWLTHMGREDGEERGPVVRFVLDASREHELKFSHIWNGATYEIRALPLTKESADANR